MPPLLVAGLTGFLSSLLLAIPIGPINLTILNEGARRGFFWALMIGLGASAMDAAYCLIAFTGFGAFFTGAYVKAVMQLFSFVFILFLGVKFVKTRSVGTVPVPLGRAAHRIEERIEERLHPHSAFMVGVARVMGNVGVLVCWVFLAANFISREWVPATWPGKLACVSGVALGNTLWFVCLSWVVSLGRGRLSEKTLLRIEHLSGVVLLLLALAHAVIIVRQMSLRH
jgi:threonine/homoserine/homoserine lactone efflux protein